MAAKKQSAKSKITLTKKSRSATAAKRAAKPAEVMPPKKVTKKAKAAASGRAVTAETGLVETVKQVAKKVVRAAASVAVKALDGDAGRKAPDFELLNEKGDRISSRELAGSPYLLYFYPKDDTPGCTREACDIRDNFGRFGKHGLRVIGVSPDSKESHARFAKKYGLPFALLSDPQKQLAKAYGVWQKKQNYGKEYMGIVRSSFLVGGDGVIKKSYRNVKVDGHVDAILKDAQSLL
jgi:peroxiredoxin Q/BCP